MENICKKILLGFLVSLSFSLLTVSLYGQSLYRKMNDFDGDGKADFAVTRDLGGYRYWYILKSTQGFSVKQWGIATDENAIGDYDGDGKFDIAIFRKEPFNSDMQFSFWVYGSGAGPYSYSMITNANPQSVPVQQDYNGDGATDLGFTHISGIVQTVCLFGNSCPPYVYTGTVLKLGDLSGDGKADIVTLASNGNNNVVSIKNNLSTTTTQTIPFGLAGDNYVPADFDGDGKGDLTVFRQSDGTWWWMRSSDNVVQAMTWGISGDVPVPSDYDGDGKTDVAIWRPDTQSQYWVYGSQGTSFVVNWGIASDTVVRY